MGERLHCQKLAVAEGLLVVVVEQQLLEVLVLVPVLAHVRVRVRVWAPSLVLAPETEKVESKILRCFIWIDDKM